MKAIIVLGSARSNGHTNLVVQALKVELNCQSIDLKTKDVNQYDYGHSNSDDDFMGIMNTLTEHDLIIFATPVYWYAMSGVMKNFFDRITDCLKEEKDTGRKLRGKYVAAISCSSSSYEPEHFFIPFRSTADYLGMNYVGDLHTWVDDKVLNHDVKSRITEFANHLNATDISAT